MRENFDEVASRSNGGDFKVQFFNLKDGEKAIVRILVDSVNDLAPFTYHEVEYPDGSKKKVSCARSIREDVSKCPLCAAGATVNEVSYIHLLQYFQNPDGTWRAEAKNWGKKPSLSDKSIVGQIRNALKEFGGLSDYISTISRKGSGRETTYTININVPEKVYGPASNYPLAKDLFDGYTEDGVIIKNWSADEMNTFINTGDVPQKSSPNEFDSSTARPAYQNLATALDDVDDVDLPFNNSPQPQNAMPFSNTASVGNPVNYGVQADATVERPVRRFS